MRVYDYGYVNYHIFTHIGKYDDNYRSFKQIRDRQTYVYEPDENVYKKDKAKYKAVPFDIPFDTAKIENNPLDTVKIKNKPINDRSMRL